MDIYLHYNGSINQCSGSGVDHITYELDAKNVPQYKLNGEHIKFQVRIVTISKADGKLIHRVDSGETYKHSWSFFIELTPERIDNILLFMKHLISRSRNSLWYEMPYYCEGVQRYMREDRMRTDGTLDLYRDHYETLNKKYNQLE